MRTLLVALLVLGSGAFAPAAAQDRPAPGARGMAWVGCWEAADGVPSRTVICVIPKAPASLRLVTIPTEGASSESTLQLDGERTAFNAEGCTGSEAAHASRDGDRIVVDAEMTCGTALSQRQSSVFAITPSGEWLHVQGTGVAMISSARVRRYRSRATLAGIPADLQDAIAPFVGEGERARAAAQHSSLSARDLVELETIGAADPVIDIVVAAAYPKSFLIDAGGGLGAAPATDQTARLLNGTNYAFYPGGAYSASSYLNQSMYMDCYSAWNMWDQRSCSRYGSSRYGMYGVYWPTYAPGIPVVIRPVVPAVEAANPGSGRAVRGRGYTETSPSDRGSAQPRSSTGATSRTGDSPSSGSTGSSAPARTARPRDP